MQLSWSFSYGFVISHILDNGLLPAVDVRVTPVCCVSATHYVVISLLYFLSLGLGQIVSMCTDAMFILWRISFTAVYKNCGATFKQFRVT